MGGALSTIITATGATIAAILGAYALVTKARIEAARPMQVLRRLWDWIETKGVDTEVPVTLRKDVDDVLSGGDPE